MPRPASETRTTLWSSETLIAAGSLPDSCAFYEHLGARGAFDVEIVERADIVEDLVPSRELFARRGQARKLRVRLEERAQEREPLVDRLVDFFELFAAVRSE